MLAQFIVYAKAKKLTLSDEDPSEILITVPGKNGATVEKRFADCTRSNLVKATKLLDGPPAAMPDTDSQRLEQMHDALRSGLGHASKIELKASYNENKGTTVNLLNVGIEELQQVLAILVSAPRDSDAPTDGQTMRAQPRTAKRR